MLPIGVGEVLRRIIGKCVTKVTKPDVIDASGSLQVCAGHKSGSEAAISPVPELSFLPTPYRGPGGRKKSPG